MYDSKKTIASFLQATHQCPSEVNHSLDDMYGQHQGTEQKDNGGAMRHHKAYRGGWSDSYDDLENGQADPRQSRLDTKTISWILKMLRIGLALTLFSLALSYLQVPQSDQSIANQIKQANQDDAKAQYNLGLAYTSGRGVEQDDAKAFKWITQAANHGLAEAQAFLGSMYLHGRGVEKSCVEALKWCTIVANQGDPTMQRELGWMYEIGRCVERDYTMAAKWYLRAAAQGDPTAQSRLGFLYEMGRGVDRSDVEAVMWLTEAAASEENPEAYYQLGMMYEVGRGVEQDVVEAIKWYTKAASYGYPSALLHLERLQKRHGSYDGRPLV
ncbi:hypothetical protein BGZ73_004078 [Actinomortierella ambigua]|nr:hypothetical protein BGZ73_004078 [Actinomortierella ambigua]